MSDKEEAKEKVKSMLMGAYSNIHKVELTPHDALRLSFNLNVRLAAMIFSGEVLTEVLEELKSQLNVDIEIIETARKQ